MTVQSARYDHVNTDVLCPLPGIPVKGDPTVYQQAEKLGGKFTRIVHGLPKNGVANFSPSILKKGDQTLIAWRYQPEAFGFRWDRKYFYLNGQPTDIYIGKLTADDTITGARNMRPGKHRLSYEDPRLFTSPDNREYVQFVTSTYASRYDIRKYSRFNQAKVAVGIIDESGEARAVVYPPIGNNAAPDKAEKNWCFFSKDDVLHCLYSTRNILIERQDKKQYFIESSCLDEATKGAPTFNSVAPIDLGDEYLVFYHWKHMSYEANGNYYLQYKVGAYTLDKDLTKILAMTKEPIFTGSLNDKEVWWTAFSGQKVSRQPALILPFGAYVEDDELVMSCGVNDHFMGIFRTDVRNILGRLSSVA